MKKLVLLAVLITSLELINGALRGPTRLGQRIPKYVININRNERIVGGEPANIEQFPYMLVLIDLSRGGFICGASVIHRQWSLTAAQCLDKNTPAGSINLRGGSRYRTFGGFLFFVDFYVLHPQYDSYLLEFDVALIRVADDSPMNGLNVAIVPISPICNTSCCHTCEYRLVTITGWGYNENGVLSSGLNQITLPIYNHSACDAAWQGIPDVFFCNWAGDGKDSCNGDGGSPILRDIAGQRYQVGIVGFGSTVCGDGSYPSVNTRIEFSGVRNWITEVSGV
ncbi:unnamed protein product [Chironomus riparius]|uniref:Peptidase S1 domain-containing protein n=1 Tax=Chironomus riparius TaxID=315576 RepID=A0A9P0JBJ8_9DIPT|nr:unnamed protein product [Chironomus riparius]